MLMKLVDYMLLEGMLAMLVTQVRCSHNEAAKMQPM